MNDQPLDDSLALQVDLDEAGPVGEPAAREQRLIGEFDGSYCDQRLDLEAGTVVAVFNRAQDELAQRLVLSYVDRPGLVSVGAHRAAHTPRSD